MDIQASLQSFSTQPLLKACRSLFKDTLNIPLSPLADSPILPKRFFRDSCPHDGYSHSGQGLRSNRMKKGSDPIHLLTPAASCGYLSFTSLLSASAAGRGAALSGAALAFFRGGRFA
jgi:hypothetical protein